MSVAQIAYLESQNKIERLKQIHHILDNAIFPSKEEPDTIEHVDLGLAEFESLIEELLILAGLELSKK